MASSSSTPDTKESKESKPDEKTYTLPFDEKHKQALRACKGRRSLLEIGQLELNGDEKAADLYTHRLNYFLTIEAESSAELESLAKPLRDKKPDELTGRQLRFLAISLIVNPPPVVTENEFSPARSEQKKQIKKDIQLYFEMAAAKGDIMANYWLAKLISNPVQRSLNPDLNLKLLELEDFLSKVTERIPGLTLQAILSKDPAVKLRQLRHAAAAGDPEAMYHLGDSLLTASSWEEGFDWLTRSLENGYGRAALKLRNQFIQQQQPEIAILFCRVGAECKSMVCESEIESNVHNITHTSSHTPFIIYHMCMFLLHRSSAYRDRAFSMLQNLFKNKKTVAALKKQIADFPLYTLETDIEQCGTEIATQLRSCLARAEMEITRTTLDSAIKQGDLVSIKTCMETLTPPPDKNQVLAEVLLNLVAHCKNIDPANFNPVRYMETAMWLMAQGAVFSHTRLNAPEAKEQTTEAKESIASQFFSAFELIFYPDKKYKLPESFDTIARQFLEQVSQTPLQADDLFVFLRSYIQTVTKDNYDKQIYAIFLKLYKSLVLGHHHPANKELSRQSNKRLYLAKLHKECILSNNGLLLQPLGKKDLKDLNVISKDDQLDLLITAISHPKYCYSNNYINLIDSIILRDMSMQQLQQFSLMNRLLTFYSGNNEQTFWVRYHTAIKILHTIKSDHPCYLTAAATLECLLDDARYAEYAKNASSLDKDIAGCDPKLADIFNNILAKKPEPISSQLERAVKYISPSLLEKRLQTQKEQRTEIENKMYELKNKKATVLVMKITENDEFFAGEQKQLEQELKDKDIQDQASKAKALNLAFQQLAKSYENNMLDNLPDHLSNIVLLIKENAEMPQEKMSSLVENLLVLLMKINKIQSLPSTEFFKLIKLLSNQPLPRDNLVQLIEIALIQENLDIDTCQLMEDCYHAITRQPNITSPLESSTVLFHCEHNHPSLIAKLLGLFLEHHIRLLKKNEQNRDTVDILNFFDALISKLLKKDLGKINPQESEKLLQIVESSQLSHLLPVMYANQVSPVSYLRGIQYLTALCNQPQGLNYEALQQLKFLIVTIKDNARDRHFLSHLVRDISSCTNWDDRSAITIKHTERLKLYRAVKYALSEESFFSSIATTQSTSGLDGDLALLISSYVCNPSPPGKKM